MQDVLALEVAAHRVTPQVRERKRRVVAEQIAQLLRRPDVELALLALAVGVLRRVERAAGSVISRRT